MCATKELNFLERVKEKTNDQIEILSVFLGASKAITYRCKVCNEENTICNAGDLVRNRERKNACRNCLMQKIATERSEKSQKKILDKISAYPTISVRKMFKQEKQKDKRWIVELDCDECNHSWQCIGTNITRSTNKWKGCPKCWYRNEERLEKHNGYLLKSKIKREEQAKESFVQYIKTRTDLKMTGIYEYKKSSTEFVCTKCGLKWKTSPSHIQSSKSGCPQCNSGMTKAKNTYIEDVRKQHGSDIEVIGKYIKAAIKIDHLCHKCGETFKSSPGSVRKGTGCPNCRISKGEERIRRYLEEHKFEFIREWRDHNCKYYMKLPMDFYLPGHNTVIEFQGIQHRKFSPPFHKTVNDLYKQQKRDQTKRDYCKENGIKLIEIWYDEMDSIETILHNELMKNIHMAS